MYFIGIDPDLHCTAFAGVNEDGEVWMLEVRKAIGKKSREAVLSMIEALSRQTNFLNLLEYDLGAVAIESQEIVYSARQGFNPRDLLLLANVSGALVYKTKISHPESLVLLPAPQEWKGSVPKPIHHARILKKLGWKYVKVGAKPREGYCYPIEDKSNKYPLFSDKINRGDWKHIMDAIGLALWARDQYLKGAK